MKYNNNCYYYYYFYYYYYYLDSNSADYKLNIKKAFDRFIFRVGDLAKVKNGFEYSINFKGPGGSEQVRLKCVLKCHF